MRGIVGLGGVVAALAAVYVLYTQQPAGPGASVPPLQHIDVGSVRASLLEIGQAQRLYVNAHGAYGTLEELRSDGAPHLGRDNRGYVFRVEPNGAISFTATATQTDPGKAGWPTLSIDETMTVRQN